MLIPALWGLKRGLIKSVFGLLGILIGIIVAVNFHNGLSLLINKFVKDQKLQDIISFITIILFFYIIFNFLANKITGTGLITEIINKTGGFIFGLFKSLVVMSIIFIILSSYQVIPNEQIKRSYIYDYVFKTAPSIYNLLKPVIPSSTRNINELLDFIKIDSLKKR